MCTFVHGIQLQNKSNDIIYFNKFSIKSHTSAGQMYTYHALIDQYQPINNIGPINKMHPVTHT